MAPAETGAISIKFMAAARWHIKDRLLLSGRLLAILFPVLLLGTAYGQREADSAGISWKNQDSVYGPLPRSMHIFRTGDSLDGRPFIAYYLTTSLKDKKLVFTTQTGQGKRFTPYEYFQLEQFPPVVVNGGFFSPENNENLNVIIKDGRMLSYNVVSLRGTGDDSMLYYYPTRCAFGIDSKGQADVAWIFTDSSRRWPYAFEEMPVVAKGSEKLPGIYDLKDIGWKWWKMRTAVGGGPCLVHDGKIDITDKEEQLFPFGESDQFARTSIGYTRDGRLIILAIQGTFPRLSEGATLEQEAHLLLGLGCYEAMNLDGGSNSCLLVNGKETIKPSDRGVQRAVPGVFLIKRK
jgi:hypothetical protein